MGIRHPTLCGHTLTAGSLPHRWTALKSKATGQPFMWEAEGPAPHKAPHCAREASGDTSMPREEPAGLFPPVPVEHPRWRLGWLWPRRCSRRQLATAAGAGRATLLPWERVPLPTGQSSAAADCSSTDTSLLISWRLCSYCKACLELHTAVSPEKQHCSYLRHQHRSLISNAALEKPKHLSVYEINPIMPQIP